MGPKTYIYVEIFYIGVDMHACVLMCRNTILRFVLWYIYLYTKVIALANVSGFFKIYF